MWTGLERALTLTLLLVGPAGLAQRFLLPTANDALLRGGGEAYFVGTIGKPWTSGTFGCVRSEGWQLHEGVDIRAQQRDRRGEPTDPILATADGTVAYINAKPSLSNYGKYLLLRHVVDGIEIYSLYAHLSEIRADLQPGRTVRAGEVVGVMGRTTNTREPISRERAHLHFEFNLLLSDRFPAWFARTFPNQRNDHGMWNGQNLAAIDPQRVFLEQQRLGAKFNLAALIQSRPELCRVQVQAVDFPWVKRYPAFMQANPTATREGVAGYEIAFDFAGVPMRLIPRAASELRSKTRRHLVSVNEDEQRKNPCRRLVRQRDGRWELAPAGERLVDLLIF